MFLESKGTKGDKYDQYLCADGLNFDIAKYQNYKNLSKDEFSRVCRLVCVMR